MPIVNGHNAEVGCYAEGSRGWYAGERVIDVAIDFGWELDAEAEAAVERYYHGEDRFDNDSDDLVEVVAGQGGIVDEAEEWLNDHTSEGFLWHWHEGEFFLSPICDDPETCTDETCAHWD